LVRDIGLHGDGLAALVLDLGHDLVRSGAAGCIIDDDGGAFDRELPGDLGPNALRCPGYHRHLTVQFLRHDQPPLKLCIDEYNTGRASLQGPLTFSPRSDETWLAHANSTWIKLSTGPWKSSGPRVTRGLRSRT